MKEDRFLIVIIIVVALLVVVSLVVFFVQNSEISYIADDTPDGVVHNYILALQQGDFGKAYGYLANKEDKPSYDRFQQDIVANQTGMRDTGIQINDVNILKDTAQVELTVIENGGGPVLSEYRHTETALLVEEDGDWKLLQMPYFYWSWNWYQPE